MSELIVSVKQGRLQGISKTSILGQNYHAFLGVPYAKPPIGTLRFKDPEPPEPWDGIRDASKEGEMCASKHMIFRDIRGGDDCLYLNVYTPNIYSPPKSVMVWIHGGGFMVGYGDSEIYGPDFLLQHNVVLVTMNYRLGVLGFLHIPECGIGNAGLKDQVFALRWIQENISKFGGNPNQITVFGNSAGSCSINLHLLSSMSRGLFHRAILQSGSAMNYWAWSNETREKSFCLGRVLGLQTNDPSELLSFLQEIPAHKLVEIQYQTVTVEEKRSVKFLFPFVPTVELKHDNAFISDSPKNLMEKGEFMKIPYLLGVTSNEGTLVLRSPEHTAEYLSKINKNFKEYLPYWMGLPKNMKMLENEVGEIKKFFFGDKSISEETLSNYCEMHSDLLIVYEVDRMNKYLLQTVDTPAYNYLFDFEGNRGIFKTFFCASNLNGASHGDEICYLFPMSLLGIPYKPQEAEAKLIQTLTKMWTNFSKTGDPNSHDLNFIWPQTDRKEFGYLEIGTNFTFRKGRPFQKRMEMWDKAYDSKVPHERL